MIIKNESATPLCRYINRGCLLNCKGCKSARYDRRDYDGFNADVEVQ